MQHFSTLTYLAALFLMACGGKRIVNLDEGFAGSTAGQAGTGGLGGNTAASGGKGGAGKAGAGGTAGAGGSAGMIDTSECISVDVGQAYDSELIDESLYVRTHAWLDRRDAGLWLALRPPALGEFDFQAADNGDLSLCSECMAISTFLDDGPVSSFVAQYGKLIVEQVPEDGDDYSAGSFENVVLYEAYIEDDVVTTVIGGDCLLIAAGSWNTAPCEPGTSCKDDFQCVPTYNSTEGVCSAVGENGLGDLCSERTAGTDCRADLVCVSGICREICEFWSPSPGCSEPQMCAPSGLCVPPEQDDAAIDQTCTIGSGWLCGGDGVRYDGRCVDAAEGAICRTTCRTTTADCGMRTCEPEYDGAEYGSCTVGMGGTGGAGGSGGTDGGAGSGGMGGT